MHRLNPFANVPTIMKAEEIIEFAHKRSTRVSMKSSLRLKKDERTRIREIARLQEFTKQVKIKLKSAVEDFPTLDRLHPFYRELTEVLVGMDRLKQALGAVYNCITPIDDITNNHLEALKLAKDYRQMKKTRSAAKGRIASLLRATSENLDYIIEAKKTMSRLPGVDPNSPTIVCAGFPNVGKSTLVKSVSTAKPDIAYYPFTTREVIIGHLLVGTHRIQIVDTPGVLDRPMSERNEIEKQAIAALKYLAHVVIFMVDASETCGWSINEQFNLLNEVRRMFPVTAILVAINKIDITSPESLESVKKKTPESYEIVATEGIGVQDLINEAIEAVDLASMEETVKEYLSSLPRRQTDSDSS